MENNGRYTSILSVAVHRFGKGGADSSNAAFGGAEHVVNQRATAGRHFGTVALWCLFAHF
jgi:hypothetical protein